jgi:F-type H+-transporting ATP synthase subunit e
LAFGIFYGFSHQSAIYSSDKKAAAQHEWDHKVKLIDEAKKKYAEKNRPAGSGDGGK